VNARNASLALATFGRMEQWYHNSCINMCTHIFLNVYICVYFYLVIEACVNAKITSLSLAIFGRMEHRCKYKVVWIHIYDIVHKYLYSC
jgi:hypothetical protein